MADDAKGDSGSPDKGVKMFTQEELDDKISKRLNEQKERFEKSKESAIAEAVDRALEEEREKLRIANLEGEDKLKATYEGQLSKQSKEMERQAEELKQAKYELARSKAEVQLAQLGLPRELAVNVIGADDETTTKNIQALSTAFNEAVSKAVSENVARGAPKIGTEANGDLEYNRLRAIAHLP